MTCKTANVSEILMADPDIDGRFYGKLRSMNKNTRVRFKAILAARQAFSCHYCKCHMTLESPTPGRPIPHHTATFEHLHDVFTSGKKDDSHENVVLACWLCNTSRGWRRGQIAMKHYSQFFVQKKTLTRLVEHPKIGWEKIVKTFGPLPN